MKRKLKQVDKGLFDWFIAKAKAKPTPYLSEMLYHDSEAQLVAKRVGSKYFVVP